MNLDNQLVFGIILIAAGIAFAIIGYVIFTNREEDEQEPAVEEVDSEDSSPSEDAIPEPAAEAPEAIDEIPLPAWSEMETTIHEEKPDESPAPDPQAEVPVLPPTDSLAAPSPDYERAIDVATIQRDEVTGDLIIKVGENVYASPQELRDSIDWTRVEYAARDLLAWMDAKPPERNNAEAAHDPSPAPKSMIQQINDILQDEIAHTPSEKLGVRLMEAPDGTVKVLVGVHSYSLDEVPDAAVQALIRKAVSTWEAQQ